LVVELVPALFGQIFMNVIVRAFRLVPCTNKQQSNTNQTTNNNNKQHKRQQTTTQQQHNKHNIKKRIVNISHHPLNTPRHHHRTPTPSLPVGILGHSRTKAYFVRKPYVAPPPLLPNSFTVNNPSRYATQDG